MTKKIIPYGHQQITKADLEIVAETLQSGWLTTGPKVEEFEQTIASYVGMDHAVAVSSGTAALHTALAAIGVTKGDEVIVPPITFAATANTVVYLGGKPIFVDVEEDTLLIDPEIIEELITPATKAILAVDYAGQSCDYTALRYIADKHGIFLLADACHSLGAQYQGKPCGSQADLSVFSFHPVKPIATGEGGMVVTNNGLLTEKMKIFRNHGITTDHRQRQEEGAWHYEMTSLGYNYRLSDLHCALGLSQMRRLDSFINKRQHIADQYSLAFSKEKAITPLTTKDYNRHGFHLYVVKISNRDQVYNHMQKQRIGCNVHYIPVHLHPWYQHTLGTKEGLCPVAEAAYSTILSLPIFPDLSASDQERIIETIRYDPSS